MTLFRILLFSFASVAMAADVKEIPINDLDRSVQLVGKLGVPLGKLVTVQGIAVTGPFKGYEGGFNLRVQKVDGKATQEDIQIVIRPIFRTWGEKVEQGENQLPALKPGETYEMEGYSTGGYVGHPDAAFKKGAPIIQTTGHYFREEFIVISASRVPSIAFSPGMFSKDKALLEGRAESRAEASLVVGNGWSIVVRKDTPWPKEVEGKQVETYGAYTSAQNPSEFELVGGEWALTRLEDQLNRDVNLRGTAWSLNGVWWFDYRGTRIYVEDMEKLPGWNADNHGRPMEVRGRLEKAMLPRLDQISLKPKRDLKEYFIVRQAKWAPVEKLLSVERVESKRE